MCGIAGLAGYSVSAEQLRKVCSTLAHRGPDGAGVHADGRIALAHTRLAIIDLSPAGAQPMTDAATGVTIVLNGEIYNFRSLREELTGVAFRGHSDTEVVLNLYLREGTHAFARLRGMFALAIWDPRDNVLHLARDRFGIKPLLIQREAGVLRFGSEAKALLALGAQRHLNLAAVRGYLEEGRQNHGPATFFAGIESLPAAHFMTWRDGVVEDPTPYWRPQPAARAALTNDEIEERVWETFLDSLEMHLVADVPVGISLSSGLDSQLIARGLAELRRRGRANGEVHAFTFGFDEKDYDEIRRVNHVDFGLPLTGHSRRIGPEECLPTLERAIRTFETPLGGLGSVGSFLLTELARAEGITVLLSGEGSDECFAGYRYYHYARLRELAESGDHPALKRELDGWAATSGERLDPASDAFRGKVYPASRVMRAPDGSSMEGNAFLGPRLNEVGLPESSFSPAGPTHLRSAMLRDLTADKLPKLLWFQDRAAMSHGVEVRVPFLDHVLFAMASSLPPEWLIRDGVAKYALKRVLRRFCGVNAFGPTKHYVATPQREWLKGPLLKPLMDWFDSGLLPRLGLIDYPGFRAAYASYAASPELGNSFFIWKMMDLEAMLREFFPDGG